MTNIIQSIWTKPMLAERWNITDQIEKNLWLYGYSVDYLKRIGLPVELYTDTYGASIFDCLGYDNIHIKLDELEDVNERFWSAGKIVAIREAPLGSIHIDGDVFLKKESIIPLLEFPDHDCIVQMEERLSIFMESYEQVLPMFRDAVGDSVKGFGYSATTSVNCGIMGFNNSLLRDAFINGYFQILEICQSDQHFMSLLKYDLKKRNEPNIVIEQYFLKGIADFEGCTIKSLLEMKSDNFQDDIADMNNQANEIGFAHAWGSSKYQIIEPIKDILAQRNPKLHQAILNKIVEINL